MFDLFTILIFFVGAAVGSFLGVVVDRITTGESIWKGRSHCDHCRHKLHPMDLIPLISFFLLDKKCRYCHKHLSWFYPIIEVVVGLAFVLLALVIFQGSMALLFNLNYVFLFLFQSSLVSILIAIFFIDLKYGIIPFKLVLLAGALTFIWYLLLPTLYFNENELFLLGIRTDILNAVMAALGAGVFFFAIFLVTKGRGMGFGDVVYAVLMGFVIGFPNVLLGLYIAFITGAAVALILILLKKKHYKGGTIPFGPFLVLGTIISMLWGNAIIESIRQYFQL